jgi:hypothetical protein
MIRQALWLVLVMGLVGLEIELFLIKHTDGAWELVPLALIGVAALTVLWYGVSRSAVSLRVLQAMMILFVASGVFGLLLHFRGNVAYERDSNPSLSGRALYQAAVLGSTPTLAPGAMIQLGLVGLVFTFRHPRLRSRSEDEIAPEISERTHT